MADGMTFNRSFTNMKLKKSHTSSVRRRKVGTRLTYYSFIQRAQLVTGDATMPKPVRRVEVEDIRTLLPWDTRDVGFISVSSDYEDEVTDADLDRLRAHVRDNFGPIPDDAVVIDGPAW